MLLSLKTCFVIVGALGFLFSLYMWGRFVEEVMECPRLDPADCNGFAFGNTKTLQYYLVTGDPSSLGGYANQQNRGLEPSATDNRPAEISQYYECWTFEPFENMTWPLQNVPQRAQQPCVLAGCGANQCLKVTSTCNSLQREKLQSISCTNPTLQTKMSIAEFVFCSVTSILGGILFLTGLFIPESKGPPPRASTSPVRPFNSMKNKSDAATSIVPPGESSHQSKPQDSSGSPGRKMSNLSQATNKSKGGTGKSQKMSKSKKEKTGGGGGKSPRGRSAPPDRKASVGSLEGPRSASQGSRVRSPRSPGQRPGSAKGGSGSARASGSLPPHPNSPQ
uniref:Uncharacterized protein n=1 Tax=Chromera velia CCMP2878 TaxID=1169474 RepID=A0A0G4GGS8_9ALVE|eukprot:Cvel_21832.t1-p1 / transcript=Cvel_21832.t1 / gene=Cvel_21832 / organism=Chromera_velia_CCMP2878 / gene_product=hypothetical protein / transcript_product=hypothetical protein / location=Cvel_scaffold2084:13691-16952(+) / protein_length=334 / sequence_SO=supercontig / SO=protein_coding / is_pseudo=false